MASVLDHPRFHSEEAAFAHVEAMLWPTGPVCPHCGNADAARIGRLEDVHSKPSKKHPKGVVRLGLRKCYACREQFTVRTGTIFEASHAPLHIWLQAIHLLCSSKKGISTRQLQRTLGVGMKTAWFLGHRIREAVKDGSGPLGGSGKVVEADETAITNSRKTKRGPGRKAPKALVVSFAERGGNVRSRLIDHTNVRGHLWQHVHPDSRLVTDAAQHYKFQFPDHASVDHSKGEYVRGDVHTNTLEGFFSIFKRGLIGVYQHVDEKHLDRYLAEFDFRQNNRAKLGIDDVQRAEIALKGVRGKRLTYRTANSEETQA